MSNNLKINSIMAAGLAATISNASFADDNSFSGKIMTVLGHEHVGSTASGKDVQFAPMPPFLATATKQHDENSPWKSTTITGSFDAVNINGETMFESGTGLRPREFSVKFNGIGEKGCSDLRFGSNEPAFYDNGTEFWKHAFFDFSPTAVAEEIPFELGVTDTGLVGTGITHRLNCVNGGSAVIEADLLYRSPSALREIIGQNSDPAEGLTGDSPYPSLRAAIRDTLQLDKNTSLQYGFNWLHMQAGEIDGVKTTEAQSSYIAHAMINHKMASGVKLRGFVEAGYIENGQGSSDKTGVYANAFALASAPVYKDLSLTFSAYGAKMPSENNFFGKYVAGAEAGIEYTIYKDKDFFAGVAAKYGAYYSKGGSREGWHDTEQILLNMQYNF